MPKVGIPTYSADGHRIRNHSLTAIERLLELRKILVKRNHRGVIVAANFLPQSSANPSRKSPHVGTQYSLLNRVGDVRLWQHRNFFTQRELSELGTPEAQEHARESITK